MPFIQTKNATIFAQSFGQDIPVLMISGMISDMASWAPISPLLRNKFTLINFDNRGAGQTICQNQNWTIDDLVADAIAVLDHYQIPRAHIIGHSMGGMIGLRVAASHPERVGTCVIMSSQNAPTQKGIDFFQEMAKLYTSPMPKEDWFHLLFHALYSAPFFENLANVKAAAKAAAAYPYAQSSQNLMNQVAALSTITPIDLTKITTPTLCLIGENDSMILPHASQKFLKPLQNTRFKTLANAAHSIHWEAPEEVANEISNFLMAHPL